jgi:drug/metabolite transporter (DMT)-like permease
MNISLFTFGFLIVLAGAAGFGLGCAWYRRALKKDPAKLEAWARQIKVAEEQAAQAIKNRT